MPTALLVTAVHWPATSRLVIALARAGFTVAAITPANHAAARLPALSKHYVCYRYGQTSRRLGRAIARAIDEVAPTIVIPCDDVAVTCLHALYAAMREEDGPHRIAALLRYSLGEPSNFWVAASKCDFIPFAAASGITVPATEIITDRSELHRRPIGRLPQVIKLNGTSGGAGVWIVRTVEAWNDVVSALTARPSWFQTTKRVVRSGTLVPLHQRRSAARPTIQLQEYIAGEPANCTVAAWHGELLACHSARVVHTLGETGPATVSWLGRIPAIERIAAQIVRRLGFTGFCGFDFVLRKDDAQPVLIEMNPRPTQTCHLPLEAGGSSLADVLFEAVTGQARRASVPNSPERLVTLFPQELWRDPKSPYLHGADHDVPWDVPSLIAAYLRPPPTDWVEQIKRWKPLECRRAVAAPLMNPLPHAEGEG